jgi:hypothetical protein
MVLDKSGMVSDKSGMIPAQLYIAQNAARFEQGGKL